MSATPDEMARRKLPEVTTEQDAVAELVRRPRTRATALGASLITACAFMPGFVSVGARSRRLRVHTDAWSPQRS
jgi:hypothetical protein